MQQIEVLYKTRTLVQLEKYIDHQTQNLQNYEAQDRSSDVEEFEIAQLGL